MAKQQYYLDKEKTQKLVCTWGFMWKNFTITLNDQPVGIIETQSQLREINEFTLPDGGNLTVQLRSRIGEVKLVLLYNGKPVAGSGADPMHQVKIAAGILLFVGVLNLVIGIIGAVGNIEALNELGIGFISAIIGLAYIGFAALAYYKKSAVALYSGIAFMVLDMVSTIYFGMQSGNSNPGFGVARIFFIIAIARGIKALKELKQQEEENFDLEIGSGN